jgi:hypothetical protein
MYVALRGLWGKAMKNSRICEWHKQFKDGPEKVEDDEKVVIQDLTEPMKMLKKCGIWYQSYGSAPEFGQRNSETNSN